MHNTGQKSELIQDFEAAVDDLMVLPLLREEIYRKAAAKKADFLKPADKPQLDDTPSQRDFGLSEQEIIDNHTQAVARYNAACEKLYQQYKQYPLDEAVNVLRPAFDLFAAWDVSKNDEWPDLLNQQLRFYNLRHNRTDTDPMKGHLIGQVRDYVVRKICRGSKP